MVRQWPLLYLKALREKPIRTNIISGSIVMLLGDGIAQSIERYHKDEARDVSIVTKSRSENEEETSEKTTTVGEMLSSYDPLRAGVMVSWAAVGDVPINLALFSVVERTMRPLGIPVLATLPQSLLKAVCFFVPGTLIRMPCFLAYVTSMEHLTRNLQSGQPMSHNWDKCLSTIQNKMTGDLGTIINNGAKLWVPMNTFFFYMVPTELRTLGLSFVTVGWMTYLSLMQHKKLPDPVVLEEPTVVKVQAGSSSTMVE